MQGRALLTLFILQLKNSCFNDTERVKLEIPKEIFSGY